MKKIMLCTFIIFSIVCTCTAYADWESTLTLSRETSQPAVTIGVKAEASTLEAPPLPPEYYASLILNRYDISDWTSKLSVDIRASGEATYCWGLSLNPHGNMGAPMAMTSVLSWDFSSLPGTFELREGYQCNGNVVVADMKTVQSHDISGTNVDQYFNIVHVPDPGCTNDPTITISKTGNGAITNSEGTNVIGDITVSCESNQTFSFIPGAGNEIESVVIDGNSKGKISTYTFENIIADHTMVVNFQTSSFTIVATSGLNGSIDPSGNVSVDAGSSKTFTITPDSDYVIDDVLVDGSSVGNDSTYTFDNINDNHTIDASFKEQTCYEWETTLTLSRETSQPSVTIGVKEEVSTLEAPPLPPEFYASLILNRYDIEDWSSKLSVDIRACGENQYCWGLSINPHGNMGAPMAMTSVLSWDFSSLPGSFELREGYQCNGTVLVADMKTVQSYDISGTNVDQFFNIVYEPPDLTPKPVIVIIGDNPETIELCSSFTDDGATASDDTEGDISNDIVANSDVDPSTVGTYSVTYNVQNSSGVSAVQKVRVVNVVDTTDPVITISGDNPMTIGYCETFNDPGATAVDPNCDTDLTDQILVEGNVDTCSPGEYVVTYSVSDASGNTDTASRTVTVLETLQCDINVSPTSHNFGSTLSQVNQVFTVSNDGDGGCNITDITLSGQQPGSYAIINDNCSDQSISSGNNCTFSVAFPSDTAATGDHFASVDISSNDPDTPTLSVSLQGTKPDDPYYPFSQPKITSSSMDLYGVISDSFDNAMSDNDVVAAFVDDGNGGQVVVGCGLYGENYSGTYGLHIYGDDESTPEKDGMTGNDTLILKIYDASEAVIYTASVISGDPSWASKATKEVDWKIRIKQSIPLVAGWNLISFSVNNCYYIGQKPTVTMLDGIEYIQVNSIDDILASLNDQFLYVRTFDETGGKDYNKTPFTDLTYMAAGYGYWIKIDENADFDENGYIFLELEGVNVSASTTSIVLQDVWNLVGHLGNQIKYNTYIQDQGKKTVPFTKIVKNNSREQFAVETAVDSISDIFQSIDGNYFSIRGSDLNGAKSYYPDIPQISDLRYTGPGYGYWIKRTGDSPINFTWQ